VLTIAELRSGDPAACTLHRAGISSTPRGRECTEAAARLDDLLSPIFEKLSDEEMTALPESVWALIDYVADLSIGVTAV
jgi:hypothetical protein